MRVGIGYDIHRTAPNRRMVLGGVEIACEFGLDGHSDADVVVHALMDAMLGAAGFPDIGSHFPPDDERFRDISSLDLLRHVTDLVTAAGLSIGNVDIVVVAEQPHIRPHAPRMRAGIAEILGVDPTCVGIKATTNEGVGPEGRCEAISAQAVCLLETVT